MKWQKSLLPAAAAALALALSACGSAPVAKAEVAAGDVVIEIKASNFSFDPNAITVHGTGTFTLKIVNTGSGAHNITVQDPQGKTLDSAEIPPNQTITTEVTFPSPGDYPFFCNHPLHTQLGMKGHFLVSGS